MTTPVLLLGSGGHAKVVLDALIAAGHDVTGWCGPGPRVVWRGLNPMGDDDQPWADQPARYALALGMGDLALRRRLFDRLSARGFAFPAIAHPAAYLAEPSVLGDGSQVMAGAVVQPDVQVGTGSIVNTGARVDHDTRIGSFSHLGPGSVLCGDVDVGDTVLLGAGATVLPGVSIGAGACVAGGAVVTGDVARGTTVMGIPARTRR
jgi:sugar O-acyltransferase (sialic acid O-acetyltransferase NeuD family)